MFYIAGKIWHAPKFQFLRDSLGFPIQARWIDLKDEDDIVQNRKGDLWELCRADVEASDFLVLYSEDFDEEQRGALVEVGMAYGMGKRVYAIGRCKSIAPNAISDVAFTHHELFTWLPTTDLVQGTVAAMAIEKTMTTAKKRRLN